MYETDKKEYYKIFDDCQSNYKGYTVEEPKKKIPIIDPLIEHLKKKIPLIEHFKKKLCSE